MVLPVRLSFLFFVTFFFTLTLVIYGWPYTSRAIYATPQSIIFYHSCSVRASFPYSRYFIVVRSLKN